MSLNDILARTEGRGIFLVMVLVCLPFVVPVSVPGVSSVSGGVVMILSLRMMWGLPLRLPRIVGGRPLSPSQQQRLLRSSVKVLRFLEKAIKPRGSSWIAWQGVNVVHMLLLALMGFLLALPVPLPFTNTLPAYAIIILAVSLMEKDGRMIWFGYTLAAVTVVFFGLISGTIMTVWKKWIS